jgi:hypothetical protein
MRAADVHEQTPHQADAHDDWLRFFIAMFEADDKPQLADFNEFYCWACRTVGREPKEIE